MFHKHSESQPEFYLPFKYKENFNVNDILKNTKRLIKNSKKYNTFIAKYADKTQVSSYKLPEITAYPIFKNTDLIPISKSNYDISYENKTNFNSDLKEANIFPSPNHNPINKSILTYKTPTKQ